jgi:sortase A
MATPVSAPPQPPATTTSRADKPRASRRDRLTTIVPPEPPRRRRVHELTGGSLVAWGLMLPGVLILLFGLFLVGGSRLEAARTQDVLYGKVANQLGQATLPVTGPIADGTPLGIVKAARLGLDQVFVLGSASEQTMLGPGLKHDSVLPGQKGTSVLVGRRATYGAPFAHLASMHIGDSIVVTTGQGTFTYKVDVVRRSNAPAVQIPSVASRLWLVTSDPVLTPSRQLMVSAALVGQPQGGATYSSTVANDQPGKGSSDRGVALLLWSQALLVLTYAATRAAMTYSRSAVWIGVTPVLLAVLWNVFENLAVFLPNTL